MSNPAYYESRWLDSERTHGANECPAMCLVCCIKSGILTVLALSGGRGCFEFINDALDDYAIRAISELIHAGLIYEGDDRPGSIDLIITRKGLEERR